MLLHHENADCKYFCHSNSSAATVIAVCVIILCCVSLWGAVSHQRVPAKEEDILLLPFNAELKQLLNRGAAGNWEMANGQ